MSPKSVLQNFPKAPMVHQAPSGGPCRHLKLCLRALQAPPRPAPPSPESFFPAPHPTSCPSPSLPCSSCPALGLHLLALLSPVRVIPYSQSFTDCPLPTEVQPGVWGLCGCPQLTFLVNGMATPHKPNFVPLPIVLPRVPLPLSTCSSSANQPGSSGQPTCKTTGAHTTMC